MSETPDQLPPKRRRRRPALSCEHCRRRKTKCDRTQPCGPCMQAKYTDCNYASRVFRTSNSPAAPAYLSAPPGGHLNVAPQIFPSDETAASTTQLSYHSPPYRTPLTLPVNGTLDDRSSRPVNALGGTLSKTRLFGQSHWMHSFGRFESIVSIGEKPIFNATTFKDEWSKTEISTLVKRCKEMSKSSKMDLHAEWLSNPDVKFLVPSRELSDTLINLYFSTGESLHRILHYPSFKREYLKYWEEPSAANSAFVIKMLLAMANGACFYQELDTDYVTAQAKKWIFAGQHWLSQIPSEKSRLNVVGLQIHCLVILARQAHGIVGDLAWVSVGSLLRTAINMGMQRDPRYFPRMTPLQAEMRRRIWATILELNVQLSLDMGMSPMISTDDYDTEPPSNIDDSDVDDDTRNALLPKPTQFFTQTTVQRILLGSLPLRLRACRLINDFRSEPTYETVLELSAQLMKASKDIAIHNQTSNASGSTGHMTQLQRNLLDISVRRFLFLLHGAFSTRAFKDPRFHFSRKVCLDSATIMTMYPSNETGTSIMPLSSLRYDHFTLLKVRSQDFFKRVVIQSCMAILHELFQQIEDDVDSPFAIKEQGRRAREPLKQIVRDAIGLIEKRVAFAENNVKGHLFLSAIYGQLQALEEGKTPDQGAVEGAIRSARICLGLLVAKTPEANAVSRDEEVMIRQEILTPPEQNSHQSFGMEDWTGGFDGAGSWLFTGWEDDRSW